ncbi:MAG TPA: hypothetical protein VLJ58_16245, partial [Ramlibacter sp.]|nr:hypothetical protein [Ramlibacter sp.]
GAADRLTGGNVAASTDGYALAFNVRAGDADVMGDDARGGADTLTAGNLSVAWAGSGDYADGYAINMMAGDSFVMYDDAVAGNDTLTGGLATFTGSDGYSGDGYGVALNIFAGDTFDLEGAATLGNDKLTGTSVAAGSDGYAINIMAGDSMDSLPFLLSGSIDDFTPSSFTETLGALDIGSGDYDYDGIQYGNDTITGGNGQAMNMMVGDGYSMGSYDTGGNDRIQAGSGLAENMLIGDAWYAYGAQGGNDTLISSTSDDVMFGDFASGDGTGGMDRFIFAPSNGEDTIVDFEVGVDKIDLIALKANPQLRSYAVMLSSNRLIDTGDDIVLHLGTSAASSDNIVTLVGVDNASDLMNSFIFV